MVNIVTTTFVGSGCPKFLKGIGQELSKGEHFAIEQEHLDRYLAGLEKRVKELAAAKKFDIRFSHTRTGDGGTVIVSRDSMGYTDFLRFSYVAVKGHLYASADGLALRYEEFLEEGGEL